MKEAVERQQQSNESSSIEPQPSTVWPARAGRCLLALTVVSTSGCVTDDQWSFTFSRAFYTNEDVFPHVSNSLSDPSLIIETPQAALLLLGFPLALDLVLLPVTLPHDVIDWSR